MRCFRMFGMKILLFLYNKQQHKLKEIVPAINTTESVQTVKVRASSYQPMRAELREEVNIDKIPERLAKSVLRKFKSLKK